MNPTYWNQYPYTEKLFQNHLFLIPSLIEIIKWHGLMSFVIKTTSINDSFSFARMLIKSIVHIHQRVEYLWICQRYISPLLIEERKLNFIFFSEAFDSNPLLNYFERV